MSTVFVTGAAGFLGRRLVARLLSEGTTVRCLVRATSDTDALRDTANAIGAGSLQLCYGDLNRMDWAAEALKDCQVVYHVAAALTGGPAVLVANNVSPTRELICRAASAGVNRFVLVSSIAVYDTSRLRSGAVVDEQCPIDPHPNLRDAYTFSKILQEEAARKTAQATGLPLVIVRPGVIYGPGRNCLSARIGLQFGNLMIKMGGSQRLPYTYVDNVADAVARAGVAPGVDGRAFNVVDDKPPTARQLVRMYRKQMGGLLVLTIPRWGIGLISGMCEKYHVKSRGQIPAVLTRYKSSSIWKPLRYSNLLAKSMLGWEPAVTFADGLDRTFSELKKMRQCASMAA